MTMLTRTVFTLALLLSMLAFAQPVVAQFPGLQSPQRSAPRQAERVTATIVVYEGDVVAGSTATVGIVLDIQPRWKIQAGLGSGEEVPPYLPTKVNLTVPDGWSSAAARWPKAKDFELVLGDFREALVVYEERLVVVVPVEVPANVSPGQYRISAVVNYQACDDSMCEMPTDTTARGQLVVVSDVADARSVSHDDELAALFEATLSRPQPATDSAPLTTESAPVPTVVPTGSTFFGFSVPRVEGQAGVLILALLSALGGFILNLTPCVLPVIPIKIMTLQQHANHPGKNLALGLWMFAGVVAFWLGIGLPVAFFAGVSDPSQIFGIWWVTFGIGAIIAIMGIGIMGMFSIQLPQSVYAINPKADTAWGSFIFGVMTAVLGLPCFGFVAGALLAGSAMLPPSTILIIFTSLGVGMGLPYLVLSAKPSLVEKIPRTGPASELVKQVMGLLLLAAAAFFVGTGLIALVSDKPYLARELHWWTVALFAVAASAWLVVRTFQISRHIGPRVTFTIIALIVGGVAVLYAANSSARARAEWLVQQEALQSDQGYLSGFWNKYTPAAFERAREDGNIVVLDFTAEWCLICKALKATVLDRDPVRSELNSNGIIKFTVDLTASSAPGWSFLRDNLGQTGIPLLVIYTPGQDEPWQGNSYTAQQVLAALENARNDQAEMLVRN